MYLKTFALCLGLSAWPLCGMAQQETPAREKGRVSGVLCDSLTRQPEMYATLRVRKSGEAAVVKAAVTDAQGRYNVALAVPGTYDFEWHSIGKAPLRRTLVIDRPQTRLDTLYVSEPTTTLGAAVVTAQRQLVKAEPDKLTYAVADDPDSRTETLLEMLRKVPMVTVDGEENIKIKGSSSFQVHVNGKPNKMMTANPSLIFKTYPASMIKRIEVVTRPGAKYDAEGVAGILNIITADETRTSGYSFTPELRAGNRGWGTTVFGMTQAGKLTLSVNGGVVGQMNAPEQTSHGEREVYGEEKNRLLLTDAVAKYDGIFEFGNLEAGYEFTAKDLLSVSAGFWGGSYDGNQRSENRMTAHDGGTTYAYVQTTAQEVKLFGLNASADYQHTFRPDETFTFSYRLETSPQRRKSALSYADMTNVPAALGLADFRSDPENKSYEHTFQADYTVKPADKHTLSTGLKYIYRLNRSDNTEMKRAAGTTGDYVIDEERSLRYRHRGGVAAAYAEYKLSLKKLTVQAGLRNEFFMAKVDYPDGKRPDYSRNINNLVPSVNLGYSLGMAQMLTLGYAMRIGRPDISYLSPYVDRSEPGMLSYGNPTLDSETSHNFEMNFSHFAQKFSLNAGLSYSLTTDGFTSFAFMNEGMLHTTYADALHRKQLAATLFVNWTIVDGTNVTLNANGSYADLRSYLTGDRNHGFSGSGWLNMTQQLPWKLKAVLTLGGSTKNVELQSTGSSYFYHALSVSRSFLADDRLTLSAMVANPFKTKATFENETRTADFRNYSRVRVDMLQFGVSLRYRLGSLKAVVKKAARSINNEDLKQGKQQNTGQGGMR